MNNIVGNAFKMAYAYQRQASLQPQQPTFNEVIQQQLEVQQQEIQQYQVQFFVIFKSLLWFVIIVWRHY